MKCKRIRFMAERGNTLAGNVLANCPITRPEEWHKVIKERKPTNKQKTHHRLSSQWGMVESVQRCTTNPTVELNFIEKKHPPRLRSMTCVEWQGDLGLPNLTATCCSRIWCTPTFFSIFLEVLFLEFHLPSCGQGFLHHHHTTRSCAKYLKIQLCSFSPNSANFSRDCTECTYGSHCNTGTASLARINHRIRCGMNPVGFFWI